MAQKIPVTLVFLDEKDNYEKSLEQIGTSIFQNVKNVTNFQELKEFIDNSDESIKILLFIHVFRNQQYKGFKKGHRIEIEHHYPRLRINWVTSDQAPQTGEKINKPHDTYRYDEIAELIENEKLIPISIREIKNVSLTKIDSDEEYIFISHSSNDEKIVTSFFENLLRLGLDISAKNIFYSSHPASGIALGEDIPDELKKALNKMTIFIQYVSKSYKKSEVCLNEMGAAWVRLPKNKILILKAPDVKFKDLGFLNIQRLALSINKKEDLLKISENYKNIFDFSSTDYALKVDKFLKDNGY